MALKVGIVGLRGIGNTHADAYMADDLGELVAVCDVVKERADEAAEKHSVKSYGSLAEMLANEDLDIVDVSTGGLENGSWHYEPVMEALEAGKNVLVEKPLSHDIGQAREMVAKANEKGVSFGCNLNHYFTEVAAKAKEYVDQGAIGEQIYCMHKMGFQGGEPENYSKPASRRTDFPYFHLKAFLAHPFSVMRYFCGDITHVQAFCNRPGFRKRGQELTVSTAGINLRFQNDCVGYLLTQRGDAAFGLGGWWSVELAGTKGTFCIENCIEKVTYWPAPAAAPNPEALDALGAEGEGTVMNTGITDFGATFPRRIHAFLEDVANGVPVEDVRASGRDALATLEYTFAAIESYESGGAMVRPHPLPPLTGDPTAID